ncbi:hypothetical protein EOW77_0003475 [Bradyrhizobium yuanmingense]|uniref:transcription termination/antitermination NusG family protein n=1 Tax=Bradyrhizobium yuanmingense TaxID=108015 RepID=UPI000FE37A18|nr:transcription termination/antitermination NusG family protein [Bradyrhizobium yuanmingense]TGN90906.1 hypothetical protein EOW77_0003475 [Bradyrhizobium yuanmingense]
MTTKLPAAFSPEVLAEMLSAEARAELARPRAPVDPRAAQLSEGAEARWCAVEIASRDAVDELAKRRFGIYQPEYSETVVSRGRKVVRRGPMFPGYVFVFLWDGNYGRLLAVDGVIGTLGSLSDEEISLVRAVENGQRWSAAKKPRHHSKRGAKPRRVEKCFRQLRSLDSAKRNQALRDLLSLS